MLPAHCTQYLPTNVDSEHLATNTDSIGLHRSTKYLKIFNFDGLIKHTYANKCACNEAKALEFRHCLPVIRNNKPAGAAGIIPMQYLRRVVMALSNNFRYSSLGKLGCKTVLEHTRKNILRRYQTAYNNIISNRIDVSSTHAKLSTFIKFEKMPESKFDEGKPPRLIQFRSYEYLYSLKSYILSYNIEMKKPEHIGFCGQRFNTVFTKLYNNEGIASVLKESWDYFVDPVALCLDHSKFDGHYDEQLLSVEHEFWNSLFQCKFLKKLLSYQINNYGFTQNGIRYKTKGHRASGEYTTSEGNGLINYAMLITFLLCHFVYKYRIHVNGDDSVIIIEREDLDKVVNELHFFLGFNMETDLECVAYHFSEIKYCQTSPVRVGGVYRMVKDPYRTMSRMAYTDAKYLSCLSRYMSGTFLCELACDVGVPILQAWCLRFLSIYMDKPLGSVDKMPAKLFNSQPIEIMEVSLETRHDFAIAFNIPVEMQLAIENDLAGMTNKDPNLYSFINKYRNFHLN